MHNNKTQETRETKNFPQGNHKGEKPCNFLRYRINTKSKTQKHKADLSTTIVSISDPSVFSLTHAPQ